MNEYNFEVKTIQETVNLINKYNASLVRFGDGEISLINGRGIPYQDYNEELSRKLKGILQIQSNSNFLVGIPDVFRSLERYNRDAQCFWELHRDELSRALQNKWYVTAFLSRPYIDLANKQEAAESFRHIRSLWEEKDILIVEGVTSRSGVGNDLFNNARSISRIICPARNAYDKIDIIFEEIKKNGKNKLILLMLGPTAKVLTHRLYYSNFQVLDIGHIDSEYEWYKMDAEFKVKLPNKHTAEYNYDQDIIFADDQNYEKSILKRIIE